MTVTPNPPFDEGTRLSALCIWREARGEPQEAKNGVYWVLKNRCAMAPAQGFKHDITGNILKPWAFSSFLSSDVNSQKYPVEGDPSWTESLRAVQSDEPDQTGGAVFYYSKPLIEIPKVWGNVEISAVIHGLTFCRFVEIVT